MRDPELMQRADRAAIALEEAWERWRAMHGLGSEPLPPVSSYVGYSLEEPWGQPRVVFGLRADEAELMASLLDGHDCVGPIYAEVSTRADRRRPVNGPASQVPRPYAGPLSVPAQAAPSPLDQVGLGSLAPDEDTEDSADEMAEDAPAADGLTDIESDPDDVTDSEPARSDKVARPGEEPEAEPDSGKSKAGGPVNSPALASLPEAPGVRRGKEEPAPGDQAGTGSSKRPPARATVAAGGPGYRGPRYQGSPPRYDSGSSAKAARQVPDDDDDDADAESTASRRAPVTKLNRGTRRRTSSG